MLHTDRKVSGGERRKEARYKRSGRNTGEQSAYNDGKVNLEKIFTTIKIFSELVMLEQTCIGSGQLGMERLKAINCFCSGRSGSIASGSSGFCWWERADVSSRLNTARGEVWSPQ